MDGGNYRITRLSIPTGEAGIRATLRVMCDLANDDQVGKGGAAVLLKAREISAPYLQKDYFREARACSNWVRDEIRYIRDPVGIELVQTPIKTLEIGCGDCDDKSTLLAALLMSIGHPCRFIAIGTVPRKFSHVFVQTQIRNHWINAETTEPWEFGRTIGRVTSYMQMHC